MCSFHKYTTIMYQSNNGSFNMAIWDNLFSSRVLQVQGNNESGSERATVSPEPSISPDYPPN